MSDGTTRRLAAIMFADMVGYTAVMQEDENRARVMRDRQREVLSRLVPLHNGEILQFYGDGTLSVFGSAVQAVECAVRIQHELREAPGVPLRIGVHSGDIVQDRDGVYGDGVNLAARVEALSAPGGILVSGKVFDEIKNHPSISTAFIGEYALRNVRQPVKVFAITNPGIQVPTAAEAQARAKLEPGAAAVGVDALAASPSASPAEAGAGERFLRRVRDRAMIQWGVLYLAGAWAALQIVQFLSQHYRWPPAVYPSLAVLAFVGFFVALVVTWFHGESGRQRVQGREVGIIAVLLMIGAAALTRLPDAGPAAAGPEGPLPVLTDGRPSVAVLPFDNLSTEPENAYFASSLHDEVITQLLHVAGLRVISRTSVLEYATTRPNVRVIGRDLGVSHVTEATVRRIGDSLQVSFRLIDARTDDYIWNGEYNRDVRDAFAVQSEIARSVADALTNTLTAEERGAMARPPTAVPEAYQYYLQGNEYYLRPGYVRQNFEAAQRLYERAVELDPSFALAHAALSRIHGLMYWENFDPSPARLEAQRSSALEAQRLQPDLPQAHAAVAWAYYVEGAFRLALGEYEAALAGMPNDAETVAAIGYTHRRLGDWPQVFEAFARASNLSPRNATLYYDLGGHSFSAARRYAEAVGAYNRALELAPDLFDAALRKGYVYVHWQGQLDSLRAAVSGLRPDLHLPEVDLARVDLALWERDPDRMLRLVEAEPEPVYETQLVYLPKTLYAAWAHRMRGDEAAARAAFEAAREWLESVGPGRPDDARIAAALGYVHAGLGRTADASQAAVRSLTLWRESGGALSAPQAAEIAASILAQAGLAADAVRQLEAVLAGHSPVSAQTLRLNPLYDPIRRDPAFRALLRR